MDNRQIPYRLLNWSILFSPLQDNASLAVAWENLGLDGEFDDAMAQAYVRTFMVDIPQPKIPLLFSATLQREASACREDWMRIASHLGMQRVGASLQPDHLALACELLAHAWVQGDTVLLQGIGERYLMPWLEMAMEHCDEPLRSAALVPFEEEIAALFNAVSKPHDSTHQSVLSEGIS